MNPYLLITLFGLALKIWATVKLRRNWNNTREARLFAAFLGICYLQVLCEMVNFLAVSITSDLYGNVFIRGYYVITTATLIMFPFSVAAFIHRRIHHVATGIAATAFAVCAYMTLATDLLVQGAARVAYSYTRIPGEYYWVFLVLALISILLSISILAGNYRRAKVELLRVKAANLLIGLIPLAAMIAVLTPLIQLGLPVVAVGLGPFLLSIYLVVLSANITNSAILDLRIYLPWSKKARMLREVTRPFRRVDLSPMDSRKLAREYEQTLIEHAIDIFNDRKNAGEWLNVSQAKISKFIGKRRDSESAG